MEAVIIAVDPPRLSVTTEDVDAREQMLDSGRFTTDRAGYAVMRKYVTTWPDRVWAVEGSNGAGRPLAQRLLEDGERVVDSRQDTPFYDVITAGSLGRPCRSSGTQTGKTRLRPDTRQCKLHARLNHVSGQLGLPVVDLQSEIEAVLAVREKRLAHFAGVDEFRPVGSQPGARWWDATARGIRVEPDA